MLEEKPYQGTLPELHALMGDLIGHAEWYADSLGEPHGSDVSETIRKAGLWYESGSATLDPIDLATNLVAYIRRHVGNNSGPAESACRGLLAKVDAVLGQLQKHEFAFDCTLTTALRVKATSRDEAERRILAIMDAAECNGGAWPNGDPVLFEASVNDHPLKLYEIDGEPVDSPTKPQTHVGALIMQIFAQCTPEDVDRVISRVMGIHPDAGAAGESFEHQMRGTGCIGSRTRLQPEFSARSDQTVGSVRHLLSLALLADGVTEWPAGTAAKLLAAGAWENAESQPIRPDLSPDPEGARQFFEELAASVETLGSIADQHGVNTLTDLMYLQQAILKGDTIDVWPGETEVGKVVQVLPSAQRWLKYTVLGGEWIRACVRKAATMDD